MTATTHSRVAPVTDPPAKTSRKAPKITTREEVTSAHATPWFNTAVEPWLPVVDTNGNERLVSTRTLLLDAHTIEDIVETDPLTRAALRRYLTAIAYLTATTTTDDDDEWTERVLDNTGFTELEVDQFLKTYSEHTWLYHPKTPFLQDARLIETATDYGTIGDLLPYLPEANAKAWIIKPTDRLAAEPLTPDEAARGLIYRWYYALPGNSGNDGANVGSVFSHVTLPITHTFRIGDTLFRTLLRNVPAHTKKGKTPAWVDQKRPLASNDWLYNYTLTTHATVLGPRTEDDRIRVVIRGPIPGAKERAKDIRNHVRENDPHTYSVLDEKKNTHTVAIEPDMLRLEMMKRLREYAFRNGSASVRGIANSADLWLTEAPSEGESLEMLCASKVGTGTSPVWEDALIVGFPAAEFTAGTTREATLTAILASCFHSGQDGIHGTLTYATRQAFRRLDKDGNITPTDSPKDADPFVARASRDWLALAERTIETAMHDTRSATDVAKDASRQIAEDALTAFDNVTRPYRASIAYSSAAADARNYLRRALRDYLD